MSRRTWLSLSVWAALLMAPGMLTQGQEAPPTPSRNLLPFATEPDRLPGPPRAMGELPAGLSQPPSTLPGRVFDQPPRAMGESPGLPPLNPSVGPFAPGLFRSPADLVPGPAVTPGLAPLSPSTSLFGPGFFPQAPGRPAGSPGPLPGGDLLASPRGPAATDPAPAGPPLTLEEVLLSSEGTHPLFRATLEERAIAAGEVTSAEGAFDLNLNMDSRNYPLGYYNRSVHDVFLEQPTAQWGTKFFGGYRLGQGRFPDYYNYLNTRGGGAFVGGLEMPLLKNRAIDAKRAKLYQTEIERRKAEPTVLKQRVSLFKDASKAYWAWLAAGRIAVFYRDLVRVAEARNDGLERQAREGLVRAIDLVDFRRILLSRRQQVVAAERRAEQAAIELSLFARDRLGFPSIPEAARLPASFPEATPPDPGRADEDAEVALRLRPEILSLRLQAEKAGVARRFARNQLLPSLSLYVYTEQNVGRRDLDLGKDFRPFILETSLLFDVPLQRRFARGQIVAADATLRQLAAQARFTCDRVRADVLDATSALRTAHDQLVLSREGEAIARRLEEAETILVREGGSTVLFLNLREQATSDAAVYRVEAESKYFSALADYRAALGLDAVPADVRLP